VLWLYWMAAAIIDIFVKMYPSLKRICKKGDAFDEEFYNEDIIREGTFIDKLECTRGYTFLKRESMPIQTFEIQSMNELFKLVTNEELKEAILLDYELSSHGKQEDKEIGLVQEIDLCDFDSKGNSNKRN